MGWLATDAFGGAATSCCAPTGVDVTSTVGCAGVIVAGTRVVTVTGPVRLSDFRTVTGFVSVRTVADFLVVSPLALGVSALRTTLASFSRLIAVVALVAGLVTPVAGLVTPVVGRPATGDPLPRETRTTTMPATNRGTSPPAASAHHDPRRLYRGHEATPVAGDG